MQLNPSLLEEIGIDDAEISRRQEFLTFDEHDARLLASLHDSLALHREDLIEKFYTHLQRFPEMQPLLGDESRLSHMKRAQASYFGKLTEGRYDRPYVEDRLHVGVIHQRIGLTPKWYISAYCNYVGEVLPLILKDTEDADRGIAACHALLKVIFFDMGLALDTYFHAERKALLMANNYTEQIVNNMPIGFMVLDRQGQIRMANTAVLRILNLKLDQASQGRTLGEFLDVSSLDEKIMQVLTSGKHCNDFEFTRATGSAQRTYLADISAARMGDEQVALFMMQDITLRKQSEDEVHRLAFYDPLTRLPNRRLLRERLLQSTSISARNGNHGALMFIDLDNFKSLNDTQGHDVGDMMLREVARRLTRNLREGDTVARLGGDEFVVVLESLSGSLHEAAGQSETIAEKIRSELGQPYQLNGIEHLSSPSIGVSLFRGHQHSIDEILKQADLAMYEAKASGRNTVCFFDPCMQSEMELRAEMEKDLRTSIRLRQLELYYQIQVDDSGGITGAEALIRWHHPQRGIILPNDFIPLAEEIGMILPIGDWVIEQACAQLKKWEMDPALRRMQLSVNVSPRQLSQPYFVEQVREAVERSGIRPSQLKLELTESFILHDVEDAIEKMEELRYIGIGFAIDDFGTGYSSLAYLKRLPLSQIKIDQSFIRDIANEKGNRAMVRAIINIASNFGLEVIAEGVESDQQVAFLRQYGCRKLQGYLFGRPVPAPELENMCRQAMR